MGSGFWLVCGVICVCAIVTNGVVKIIHAAKSGGKAGNGKLSGLEADVESLEADLDDARERIVVLEKIVTDERYDLGKKIDDLAN